VYAAVQVALQSYSLDCRAYALDKEGYERDAAKSPSETPALVAARARVVQLLRETARTLETLISDNRTDDVVDAILEVDLVAAALAVVRHDAAASALESATFASLRGMIAAAPSQRGQRAASAGLHLLVLSASGRRKA